MQEGLKDVLTKCYGKQIGPKIKKDLLKEFKT